MRNLNNNRYNHSKKMMLVFAGTLLMAIGLNFFIISEQGVDPLSTFLDGLTQFIPINLGTMISIFNVFLLVIIFFVDKRFIGLGSFINAFFLGVFSNVLYEPMMIVNKLPTPFIVLIGIIIFPLGIAIYMKAEYGFGSLEALMMTIVYKSGIKIVYVRTTLDIVFILIGLFLGASFGYGSVGSALLTGKLISVYMEQLNKVDNYAKEYIQC